MAHSLGDVLVADVVADPSSDLAIATQAFSAVQWGPEPQDAVACCKQLVVGRFAADGAHVFTRAWSDFLPLAAVRPTPLTVDDDGVLFVAGAFDRDFLVGGVALEPVDDEDAWVIALDPVGDVRWATALAGTLDERAHDLAVGDSGHVYVAGSFSGSLEAGASTVTTPGDAALFLARISPQGVPEHVVGFDTTVAGDLTLVADGDGVLVAGAFEGGLDLGDGPLPYGGDDDGFVARFTSTLVVDGALSLGGPGDQHVGALARDEAGAVWISGSVIGDLGLGAGALPADGRDVFWARLDAELTAVEAGTRFAGAGDQRGHGLALDGDVVLLADGEQGIDFGGAGLLSEGSRDVFVARLNPASLP